MALGSDSISAEGEQDVRFADPSALLLKEKQNYQARNLHIGLGPLN